MALVFLLAVICSLLSAVVVSMCLDCCWSRAIFASLISSFRQSVLRGNSSSSAGGDVEVLKEFASSSGVVYVLCIGLA